MNPLDIVPGLVGAAIGGAITWRVSKHYYERAANELRQEAARLGRLNELILHGLENADIVELVRGASGRPIGIVIKGSGVIAGKGKITAEGEVIPRESPNHNVTDASAAGSADGSG